VLENSPCIDWIYISMSDLHQKMMTLWCNKKNSKKNVTKTQGKLVLAYVQLHQYWRGYKWWDAKALVNVDYICFHTTFQCKIPSFHIVRLQYDMVFELQLVKKCNLVILSEMGNLEGMESKGDGHCWTKVNKHNVGCSLKILDVEYILTKGTFIVKTPYVKIWIV